MSNEEELKLERNETEETQRSPVKSPAASKAMSDNVSDEPLSGVTVLHEMDRSMRFSQGVFNKMPTQKMEKGQDQVTFNETVKAFHNYVASDLNSSKTPKSKVLSQKNIFTRQSIAETQELGGSHFSG